MILICLSFDFDTVVFCSDFLLRLLHFGNRNSMTENYVIMNRFFSTFKELFWICFGFLLLLDQFLLSYILIHIDSY